LSRIDLGIYEVERIKTMSRAGSFTMLLDPAELARISPRGLEFDANAYRLSPNPLGSGNYQWIRDIQNAPTLANYIQDLPGKYQVDGITEYNYIHDDCSHCDGHYETKKVSQTVVATDMEDATDQALRLTASDKWSEDESEWPAEAETNPVVEFLHPASQDIFLLRQGYQSLPGF